MMLVTILVLAKIVVASITCRWLYMSYHAPLTIGHTIKLSKDSPALASSLSTFWGCIWLGHTPSSWLFPGHGFQHCKRSSTMRFKTSAANHYLHPMIATGRCALLLTKTMAVVAVTQVVQQQQQILLILVGCNFIRESLPTVINNHHHWWVVVLVDAAVVVVAGVGC